MPEISDTDLAELEWWRRVIGCRFGPPWEPGALPPIGTTVGGRHFFLCERKDVMGERFYVPVPAWRTRSE